MMLRPSPRLLQLTLALVALALAVLAVRVWRPEYNHYANLVWLATLAALLALVAIDILAGLRRPAPAAKRLLPAAFGAAPAHRPAAV